MHRRWVGNERRGNRYFPPEDEPIVQYEETPLANDDEFSDGVVVYESEADEIRAGIIQKRLFSERHCQKLEEQIELMIEKGDRGEFKKNTVDRAPLRVKYFFGEGYTYGDQLERKGPGMERLYPKAGPEAVDPVPEWIKKLVIAPCVQAGLIPSMDWANSAVINDYFPGGCIVSHIDPIQLFDRPIISVNLLSDSALCFGCKFSFKPIRVTPPVVRLPMKRGVVTLLSGYAADGITHCVRPEDVVSRRQVIIIRRVLPDAPRLPGPTVEPYTSLRITVKVKPTVDSGEESEDSAVITANGGNDDRVSVGRSRKRPHGRDSGIKKAQVSSSTSVPLLTPKKHPRIVF